MKPTLTISASKPFLYGLELAANKVLCTDNDPQVRQNMVSVLNAVYKDLKRHYEGKQDIRYYAPQKD